MSILKKAWSWGKKAVQTVARGIGSILSPETKVEIKLDTVDWVTGQVSKTVESITGQSVEKIMKEAALRDVTQKMTPFLWIGGAVLLVFLLMRK